MGFIFPNFRGENKKYLSCHLPVLWGEAWSFGVHGSDPLPSQTAQPNHRTTQPLVQVEPCELAPGAAKNCHGIPFGKPGFP